MSNDNKKTLSTATLAFATAVSGAAILGGVMMYKRIRQLETEIDSKND